MARFPWWCAVLASSATSPTNPRLSDLFVFNDIDLKRVEGSSALIGERTSSTPFEFHLGTAQRRPNCRARIRDGLVDQRQSPRLRFTPSRMSLRTHSKPPERASSP